MFWTICLALCATPWVAVIWYCDLIHKCTSVVSVVQCAWHSRLCVPVKLTNQRALSGHRGDCVTIPLRVISYFCYVQCTFRDWLHFLWLTTCAVSKHTCVRQWFSKQNLGNNFIGLYFMRPVWFKFKLALIWSKQRLGKLWKRLLIMKAHPQHLA